MNQPSPHRRRSFFKPPFELNHIIFNVIANFSRVLLFESHWDVLNDYSYQYNHQRLHAGIKYLRPADMFFGRGQQVLMERKRKIESARKFRKQKNYQERLKNMH